MPTSAISFLFPSFAAIGGGRTVPPKGKPLPRDPASFFDPRNYRPPEMPVDRPPIPPMVGGYTKTGQVAKGATPPLARRARGDAPQSSFTQFLQQSYRQSEAQQQQQRPTGPMSMESLERSYLNPTRDYTKEVMDAAFLESRATESYEFPRQLRQQDRTTGTEESLHAKGLEDVGSESLPYGKAQIEHHRSAAQYTRIAVMRAFLDGAFLKMPGEVEMQWDQNVYRAQTGGFETKPEPSIRPGMTDAWRMQDPTVGTQHVLPEVATEGGPPILEEAGPMPERYVGVPLSEYKFPKWFFIRLVEATDPAIWTEYGMEKPNAREWAQAMVKRIEFITQGRGDRVVDDFFSDPVMNSWSQDAKDAWDSNPGQGYTLDSSLMKMLKGEGEKKSNKKDPRWISDHIDAIIETIQVASVSDLQSDRGLADLMRGELAGVENSTFTADQVNQIRHELGTVYPEEIAEKIAVAATDPFGMNDLLQRIDSFVNTKEAQTFRGAMGQGEDVFANVLQAINAFGKEGILPDRDRASDTIAQVDTMRPDGTGKTSKYFYLTSNGIVSEFLQQAQQGDKKIRRTVGEKITENGPDGKPETRIEATPYDVWRDQQQNDPNLVKITLVPEAHRMVFGLLDAQKTIRASGALTPADAPSLYTEPFKSPPRRSPRPNNMLQKLLGIPGRGMEYDQPVGIMAPLHLAGLGRSGDYPVKSGVTATTNPSLIRRTDPTQVSYTAMRIQQALGRIKPNDLASLFMPGKDEPINRQNAMSVLMILGKLDKNHAEAAIGMINNFAKSQPYVWRMTDPRSSQRLHGQPEQLLGTRRAVLQNIAPQHFAIESLSLLPSGEQTLKLQGVGGAP